jgi:hypothetical protein
MSDFKWKVRSNDLADIVLLADIPVLVCFASIPSEFVHILVHNSQLAIGHHSDRCCSRDIFPMASSVSLIPSYSVLWNFL